jgi:beta-lactamase regulating signal transducer with metallopeptidase domain
MSLNIIASVFTDQLIAALCNTLVYSLLQGVVLAAVAGLVIVFTRKASAAMRYNLLVGVLVLFAISTAITFVMEFGQVQKAAPLQTVHNVIGKVDVVTIVDQSPLQTNGPGFMGVVSGYLHTYHNTIVLVWFLIICAKAIQLATGLQGIYRLKRTKVYSVNAEWEQWVQQMVDRLGIKQKIALLESGIAKVPMVIGHLKPVILIPMGLLTALTTAEVEAILMHELAHIRRRDYLVNLLQSLVEIVFFFNPAVLWVSQLIKTEREHCCDDMALAQNTSKSGYIRALVSCQEYQATPAYAMAFPGQKHHLVDRVKRLVTNRNHSLDVFEKTLLTVCLVTAGLLTTAFSNAPQLHKLVNATKKAINHATENIAKPLSPVADKATSEVKPKTKVAEPDETAPIDTPADTIPRAKLRIYEPDLIKEGTKLTLPNAGFTTYIYKQDGTLYQFNLINSEVKSVQINAETLTKNELALRKPEIDRILSKLDAEQATITQKLQADQKAITAKQVAASEKQAALSANINRVAANLSNVNTNLGHLNTNLSGLNVNANTNDTTTNKRSKKIALSPLQPYSSSYRSTYPNNVYKPDTGNYNKNKYKTKADKYTADREQAIDEMIKDGLIKSRDNLSFKLSTKEFIINDKKQPDDVYQKYRAKYVKVSGHGDWTWMYNFDTEKHRETNTVIDNAKN